MAYNPSDHKAQNQPFGVGAIPLNAKSLFYDTNLLKYRYFQSTAEVNTYFANLTFRDPTFDVIVNTGGTLLNGVITGGTNDSYWYKDGTADVNLVLKTPITDLSNYYTKTQIDLFLITINASITTETESRIAADLLKADKTYVDTQDGILSGAITSEVNRALASEASLANNIDLKAGRMTALYGEIGETEVEITELIGQGAVILEWHRGQTYIHKDALPFNAATGVVTLPYALEDGEQMSALWSGAEGQNIDFTKYLRIDQLDTEIEIRNIFDKSNYRDNTIISSVTGAVSATAGCKTTQDLEIPDGMTDIAWSGLTATQHRIAFFDVGGELTTPVILKSGATGTIPIPADSVMFRFMFQHPTDVIDLSLTFILVYGIKIPERVLIATSGDFDYAAVGTQQFNKDDFTEAYIDPVTFVEVPATTYKTSNLMKCQPFTSYTASGMASDNYGRGVAFYDINKDLIGGVLTSLNVPNFTITTIAGAEWWKFTYKTNDPDDDTDANNIMVAEGTDVAELEAYIKGIVAIQNSFLVASSESGGGGGSVVVPTKDKRTALFGDSITETININGFPRSNWPVFADTQLQWNRTDTNYAKSGAGFVHTAVPDYPEQWLSVQIQHAIDDAIDFELIVVSLLTNDLNKTLGDYDTAMSKSIGSLDLTIVMESARSCFYTIREEWPNAQCYYALPLQRASMELEEMLPYIDGVRKMAQRYGFIVIEATYESGIIKDFETVGVAGRYLSDGLHPNVAGQKQESKCYVSTILNTYKSY